MEYIFEFWWMLPVAFCVCLTATSTSVEGAVFFAPIFILLFPWAAGVTIVGVQEADGFVIMWPENGDYLVAPWREGSVFVPPYHWYHMHFNSGSVENRQLRIRAPRPGANPAADAHRVIPFAEQDPWIRRKFEEELAKRGLTSLMPEEAYTNPNFEWDEEWLRED